jgi:uncharacterized protein YkwD
MKRLKTIAAALTTGAAVTSPAQAAITDADSLEGDVAREVNDVRVQHGLPRYTYSLSLARAANAKSHNMAAHGYFTHDEPGGVQFWRQVLRYYGASGFRKWQVGQTLLWTAPNLSAQTIVQRWLASPSHRAVVLNRNFREAGVSAVRATRATGVFAGQNVTIVTLDVGYRRR